MSAPSTAEMAARLVAEGAPPESAHLAAGMLIDRLSYPAHGGVPIVLDKDGRPAMGPHGSPVTVSDLLASFRAEIPQLFGSVRTAPAPVPVTAPPVNESLTAKVAREHREQRQAPATAPTGESNPWAAGSINITRQVAMLARDPERAAQLQAEAAAR